MLEHVVYVGGQVGGARRLEQERGAVVGGDLDGALFDGGAASLARLGVRERELGARVEEDVEVGRRLVQHTLGHLRMHGDLGHARPHEVDKAAGEQVLLGVRGGHRGVVELEHARGRVLAHHVRLGGGDERLGGGERQAFAAVGLIDEYAVGGDVDAHHLHHVLDALLELEHLDDDHVVLDDVEHGVLARLAHELERHGADLDALDGGQQRGGCCSGGGARLRRRW